MLISSGEKGKVSGEGTHVFGNREGIQDFDQIFGPCSVTSILQFLGIILASQAHPKNPVLISQSTILFVSSRCSSYYGTTHGSKPTSHQCLSTHHWNIWIKYGTSWWLVPAIYWCSCRYVCLYVSLCFKMETVKSRYKYLKNMYNNPLKSKMNKYKKHIP